ncbi:hypothetical protein DPEC_G00006990 [Dallia pectoralis]|uniref:Uncharacterized protein n=1 Tax=Dallia pectoralis TaxID=75939 RepID=A0ACC2HL64_DALPE|nr:hypothetical protein DPEC_G00006990 [Dallia pectoralis]
MMTIKKKKGFANRHCGKLRGLFANKGPGEGSSSSSRTSGAPAELEMVVREQAQMESDSG